MFSLRRLALLLALCLPAMTAALAQSSSSNSNPATPAADQGQAQAQPQQPDAAQTPGQISVQGRIRARRAQRREAAIHEVYDHLYEAYAGFGYARFTPGPGLQRVHYIAWDAGLTRYFNERLGVTLDGRGYYANAFVGLVPSSITKPKISTYAVMAGPTYRFYLQPRYSLSARVMGGWGLGDFSGDTNGIGGATLGLYPDGSTYAASAGIVAEYNLTPNVGLRLAPEYFFTGFGSTIQYSRGATGGIVYRFGKQ